MNRTKIEWCTHVHNIMTGCLHGCPYCYARKTAENPFYHKAFPYGFEPHFYPERMSEVQKLKKPAIIFMDSMSDIFGSWWTDEQILKVLHIMDYMRGVHWHKYVVLTKNPERMSEVLGGYAKTDGVDRLKNVYFGLSLDGFASDANYDRLAELYEIHKGGFKTVLSLEPLLYNPEQLVGSSIGIAWLDWIIVGGQTKPTKIPEERWVINIAKATYPGQPLLVKKNCGEGYGNHFHDFPVDLLPIAVAWGKI